MQKCGRGFLYPCLKFKRLPFLFNAFCNLMFSFSNCSFSRFNSRTCCSSSSIWFFITMSPCIFWDQSFRPAVLMPGPSDATFGFSLLPFPVHAVSFFPVLSNNSQTLNSEYFSTKRKGDFYSPDS